MSVKYTKKGFTLLELIIVIIIIGIFAAFAVPQYMTAVQKAKQKSVRSMLLLMRSGQGAFYSNANDYFPPQFFTPFANLSSINQNLGLSIIQPSDIYYECERAGPLLPGQPDFTCHGYHPQKAGYRWHIQVTSTTGPTCDPANECL